ncbi:MAG: molybdopterin-dependent oxidoreductase [Promethearchaeota archaeon]|jgi:anaerobic selenocysteine-containing dehydrogenase
MDEKSRFGTCTKDCYGACVFKGIWDDSEKETKFIRAQPQVNHPFTNGFFCPKFKRRRDLLYHPQRIKVPLRRNSPKPGNKFEKILSQKAFNIISQKILELKENNELGQIIGAFYAGNSGLISMYSPLRFFRRIGATITRDGICNEGGSAGLRKIFGTYSITNPFQINDPATRLIVIWGSNLSESNNHAYFLVKQAIRSGTKVVVADSRHTRIAEKSTCFLQIYPGTEHLLVKLIINALNERNVCDSEFLTKNVAISSPLFSKISTTARNKILQEIGITYEKLEEFTDLLVEFKHQTMFLVGYGVQKDLHGGRIVQAIALIQILLGNIGKRGTGLVYSQSAFLKPVILPLLDYISQKSDKFNAKEVSLIKLGKTLLSGDFKMLFVYNFNPVSSLPNQKILRDVLLRKDLFVVVLDLFFNETTKYADIIIPAKFDLETSDIIAPYYIPSLSINSGGPCPYPNCVSNYEFFQQLGWRIEGKNSPYFKESEEEIFKRCLTMLPPFISKDLSTKGFHLHFDQQQLPFQNLKFPTPDTKIQIQNIDFSFGKYEQNRKNHRKENEFILISPSHYHFLHSQLGQLNPKYLDDFGKIFLNSKDIADLGLFSGNEVHVSNEFGSAKYILSELESLKPGVALIYHGLSSPHDGFSNVNLFTPDVPEELGFSGSYNSVIIQIQKA